MKYERHEALIRSLVLAALAICFSAATLSAQMEKGTFSLPFETRWGSATLPAGDYSFSIGTAFEYYMVTIRRNGMETVAKIFPQPPLQRKSPARSQLLVVGQGKTATVHILYLADMGTEFHFSVPPSYEVYTRLVAQASGPITIEHIPVVTHSGK